MKNFACGLLWIIGSLLTRAQTITPLYHSFIKKAESFYAVKDYKSAGLMYSAAFETSKNYAFPDDRYNAVRMWALAEVKDSAMNLLRRIVNWRLITDEERLTEQKDFSSLTNEPKWKEILDTIRLCSQPRPSVGQFPDHMYCVYVKKADSLHKAKEYKKSGKMYSAAFRVCGNSAYSDHRYNAARAWALAGVNDSAFEYLQRIVQKKMLTDEKRLQDQEDFKGLHQDIRWKELMDLIVDDKESMEIPFKWHRAGSKPKSYDMGIDKGSDPKGKNAAAIKSINAKIEGFGTLMSAFNPDPYRGKKIRMSGLMKSIDVKNWAGFWMRVDGKEKNCFLSFDNMHDRAVKGSTNWTRYEIILDVPEAATKIVFGALLTGTGKIWFDELKFEVVEKDDPKGSAYLLLPVVYDFEE
ncbi:MAG: hypothetical protein ACJ76F_00625 [Bacteroidia bacterium]